VAGHSKWANMRHRKARQDAKRTKVFTKIIRELTVAAKGGANIEGNPRLRAAVEKAYLNNLKKDIVERAIARGAGTGESDAYEELTYEGYGINGVAFIVECMTDNRNRTVGDVRHAFDKRGGNLGTNGSVSYLFQRRGYISFAPSVAEDLLMEAALEAGAEDVQVNPDTSIDVITRFEDFFQVKDALAKAGFVSVAAETLLEASMTVALDHEATEKNLALIDALEDLDDVQNVYTNADFAEENSDETTQ
jgi:YebC/PmpR family DNA-binding regulatory protein